MQLTGDSGDVITTITFKFVL